jgi:hypothetical protein
MKTPREILISRHASANAKLDTIRSDVVRVTADVNQRNSPVRKFTFGDTIWRSFALPFRELIWSARRIWAGFAVAWLVIVAVNLADSEPSTRIAAGAKPPPAGIFMGWEQQEKLIAELMGQAEPSPADRPKPAAPRPHSERRRGLATA